MKRFNIIYATYYTPILNFIKSRMNDKVVAEDITSETFNSVFKNLENFDETKGNIKAWIYKIAKNKIIDYYRANASKATIHSIDAETDDENSIKDVIAGTLSTDSALVDEETKDSLNAFMKSRLDENEMKLMKMFCDGYTYKEISEDRDINVQNVKNIMHKARLKMRACENQIKEIVL